MLATWALAFAGPSAQTTSSIEVERDRLARAIQLGFLPEDEVAALLVAEDWTRGHLPLDALGRKPLARRAARLHSAAVLKACAHERPEIREGGPCCPWLRRGYSRRDHLSGLCGI